ncbi:MAG: SgcJ/EcaC family oxidoreductase, partial [Bacteroidota bacterium]
MLQQAYAEKPEDIPVLFAEAWNRNDAYALANLFVEDAEFVNVVGLWWHNREAIWKAHAYGLRVIFPEAKITVRRVKVRELSPSLALVHARAKLSGQSAFGGVAQPADRQNLFSLVVEKRAQGWVAISAHNTDIVP